MRHLAMLLSAFLVTGAASGVQNPSDTFIAAVEGRQANREGELVGLTLDEDMKKLGVPGASIAVIKDWGFECLLFVHKLKGYGFAAMANSDSGGRLVAELRERVAAAYQWDTLDQPLRR